MAYTLMAYLGKLQRARADLPQVIAGAVEEATVAAVDAVTEATPPKSGTGRGPYIGENTVTGALKAAWKTDSETKPGVTGSGSVVTLSTRLVNRVPYASYVNDGHRMDRHFVPGLYIDPETGILTMDPGNTDVGIVVGTKTPYVKGEFMVDKGKEPYRKTLGSLLGVKVREVLT